MKRRRKDFYQEKSRFETDDSCQKHLPFNGGGGVDKVGGGTNEFIVKSGNRWER